MKEKLLKTLPLFAATFICFLLAGIFLSLVICSCQAFQSVGFWELVFSTEWNPSMDSQDYGAGSFVLTTILVAVLAILISIPFSLSLSVLNIFFLKRKKIVAFFTQLIGIMAKVPSIIWGIWGYYSVRYLFSEVHIGYSGFSILTATIVLAIMLIPYAASLTMASIEKVPKMVEEVAYSLGATQMEVVFFINIPYAKAGILYAHLLSLSKALGESMIVVMLIGRNNTVPHSITDMGNTIASLLVDQFGTADNLQLSVLFALALLLFLLTTLINVFAAFLFRKTLA